MNSQEVRAYFRERGGWNWVVLEQPEKPKPRPTHWKYGASHLMIPSLYADLPDVIKEVHV